MQNKIKISQDELYKYLCDHDVKVSRIAKLMDVSPSVITECFKHSNNRHGNPRYFSVENIRKLNEALEKFAEQLRSCLVTFGSDKMYTNSCGRVYDPGMIEPLNNLGEMVNLLTLIQRVLGWSKAKKVSVFSIPASKAYGNISESDVAKINAEILAVAGVLDGVEVMPDEKAFKGY